MSPPSPTLLTNGPMDAKTHLVLAHGAGSPMSSPFLETLATLLAARGITVHRFEFDYMRTAQETGRRRPPPNVQNLCKEYVTVIEALSKSVPRGASLLIGGKSLGGRVASLIAGELARQKLINGVACFGYPFHPVNKPDQLRTDHLKDLKLPVLILQGERDPFGSKSEVDGYGLSDHVELVWLADGDHDFGPRGASPATRRGNLERAADETVRFSRQVGS
jgi:uncharacterized protein